jgi:hypothetical protein
LRTRLVRGLPDWYAAVLVDRPRLDHLTCGRVMALDDAREKVEAWRAEHNEVRPHRAIGDWDADVTDTEASIVRRDSHLIRSKFWGGTTASWKNAKAVQGWGAAHIHYGYERPMADRVALPHGRLVPRSR